MEVNTSTKVPESNNADGTPIPVIRENCAEPCSLENTVVDSNTPVNNDQPPEGSIVSETDTKLSPTPSEEKLECQSESGSQTQNIPVQVNAGAENQSQERNETNIQETQQITSEKLQPVQAEKIEAIPAEKQRDQMSSAASTCSQSQHERVDRNQSDIFSLKNDHVQSSIFSIKGTPSKRVYKQREVTQNNIFPGQDMKQVQPPSQSQTEPEDKMRDKNSYHNVKRPSSSMRNPLTGTGLISNDEYRFRRNRRKAELDGNPLLGVGYPEQASPVTSTPVTPRVPPGGFSHNLW